ncbi:MAG: LysE family transporter [Bacteroidales bacterium]|nr:LysE family transporter [Bacteroidales bacterium]
MTINLIIKGFIAGVLVSAPLGPIGILCIQRTLNRGRLSGFISGIGAAVADTVFAVIAGLGLSIIINFIRNQHLYFQIAGGLFVLYIGIRIFYTNPIKQLKLQRLGKTSLSQDFFSVLLLTLSNPMALFLFIGIMAGINIALDSQSLIEFLILLAGIFGGAALWWFFISTLANRFRKVIRLRSIWWMNKVTGALIFLFGLSVIFSVWFF